ncbi:MAG TPA: EAL domain-containing protein [Usitatibacter sp.]|nr:EAL domain-containing protein [Usitatibacter sp.]
MAADDENTTRALTRAVLESSGFRVVEARDGNEALEVFERDNPDLVLLDVEMPGLDGLEVLRSLRNASRARDVPVVMATGLGDVDSISSAYSAGATDFISKPINWALLPHRLRYILRSSRVTRDLAESEEKFRLITESSADFIALLDLEGRRLYSSPSYRAFFGTDLAGSDSFREIHPDDLETIRNTFRETVESGVGRAAKFRWILPDRSLRYLESKGSVIRDETGKVSRVVVVSTDVTERTLQQEKIERLNRITSVLGDINSAIVRIRDRGELLAEACRIAVDEGHFAFAWAGLVDAETQAILPVAWTGNEQGFLGVAKFSAREDVPEGNTLSGRVVRGKRPVVSNDIEKDAVVRHGKLALARGFRSVVGLPLMVGDTAVGLLVLYSLVPGYFDDEEMRLLEELAGDISFGLDHIEKEREVHHLAYYDPLTGLANRRLFQETLGTLVEASRRTPNRMAVVVIDARGFHVVNDNLGRHAGDAFLKSIGERISGAVASSDTVGRIGGDQFAVILSELAHDSQVASRIGKIFEALDATYELNGQSIRLLFKGGVSIFPTSTDGATSDALLTNAEAALKRAKDSADMWLFYEPHLNAANANRLVLESALSRALASGEFRLLYQPKVDPRSGRVTGLEALLYWNRPGRGLTPPGDFIPALEDTGMILGVGSWAIRQAMSDVARLRGMGYPTLRVAVNVSPVQFRQRDFPAYLASALGTNESLDGLDIEITESVMMEDIEACIAVLWRLQRMGIGVALDDFGTGYSSLNYVAQLPAGTLKIDKSFVDDVASNPRRLAIVSTVISLAHALGMKVVAEGVETMEQERVLRDLDCDEVQGFLYSRPIPIEQLEAMLRKAPAAIVAG